MARKPRPKKFYPDPNPFHNAFDAIHWILIGGWTFWCGRPKHPAFMKNLSLIIIENGVRFGRIKKALPNNPISAGECLGMVPTKNQKRERDAV